MGLMKLLGTRYSSCLSLSLVSQSVEKKLLLLHFVLSLLNLWQYRDSYMHLAGRG